jgi:hypothetical protein
MLVQDFTHNSTLGKHYYIKRKLIKDQVLIYNGSIFPTQENNESSKLISKDSTDKYQTLPTNIDNTVTLNSNN